MQTVHDLHHLSEQFESLLTDQTGSLLQVRMTVVISGLEEHKDHLLLLYDVNDTIDSVQIGCLRVDCNEFVEFAIWNQLGRWKVERMERDAKMVEKVKRRDRMRQNEIEKRFSVSSSTKSFVWKAP